MYRHTATARGKFPFPLDMLRYDACFPADGASVAAMDASLRRERTKDPFEVKLVKYTRVKEANAWTHGRWTSFTWFVIETGMESCK
jgi:hypothetical protein